MSTWTWVTCWWRQRALSWYHLHRILGSDVHSRAWSSLARTASLRRAKHVPYALPAQPSDAHGMCHDAHSEDRLSPSPGECCD